MRDYQDTIQIISGIMGRYDEMMPGIFNEMNKYEKQMLLQHPRHVFLQKSFFPLFDNRYKASHIF